MSPSEWKYEPTPTGLDQFRTTHWNVVLLAGEEKSPKASEALEKLCRNYSYPLYAYLRRLSYGPEDAQHLGSRFFARLLAGNAGATIPAPNGKFRSFVLAALNHFLAHEREPSNPAAPEPLLIDGPAAEGRYLRDSIADLSPEGIFEREWAVAVLERALAGLREEYAAEGKTRHFALLKSFLTCDATDKTCGPAASELKVSAGSIAVTVHRMRQRFSQLARAEIADTVAGVGDIDDEMRWLVAVLN